jgi:phage gpG-like protein
VSATSFHSNAPEVAANLDALAGRVGDPSAGLEHLRQALALQESEVWATEGAVIGEHWPPSADPERKSDSRLLVASGALRASLADPSAGKVEGDRLEFGTDVPYGRFHQYGGAHVPQRQFLGVSPLLARQLADRLASLTMETE